MLSREESSFFSRICAVKFPKQLGRIENSEPLKKDVPRKHNEASSANSAEELVVSVLDGM